MDSQISRTGALQVTTDDGDSVTISFAALDQLHAESFRGQSGDSRLAYGSASTESGVAIDIKVDGSLDSGEVADITALLGQLAQAIHDPGKSPVSSQFADGGSFDSLSSFQFGYQERAQTAVSSSAVLTA